MGFVPWEQIAKSWDQSGPPDNPPSGEPGSARLVGLGDGRARHHRVGVPHRVLGLRADERDPVVIILAAQLRLRRWRRPQPVAPEHPNTAPIRAIVSARDAMLREALARLSGDPGSSAGLG